MSAALLHGPLQVCTANHLTSMLRKELVRNSSEVEETLVPPSPCLKGVLLRLFLDCSLTAQQHKSYLLSPVKFFSPEHTCRSYDEASCSSGNTSGMQREATHVQSTCYHLCSPMMRSVQKAEQAFEVLFDKVQWSREMTSCRWWCTWWWRCDWSNLVMSQQLWVAKLWRFVRGT